MIEFSRKKMRAWSLAGPSGAVGTAAVELAEISQDIMMLTSDLCFFSGLDRFKSEYPERLLNVGIAEQNMVGIAAGLAKEGFIPFVNTYASFASRCADQIRVNMSYMGLPIKFIGLTSGYASGILGATHMCIEDIALMRALPNIVAISPADCTEIIKAMLAVYNIPNPVYIRLTGTANNPMVYTNDYSFEIGKAIKLRNGEDVCIIATGSMVYQSLKAAEILEERGISASVVNMHTIKPIDFECIVDSIESHRIIVTVEEHNLYGGLYSAVSECIVKSGLKTKVVPIGINDYFPHAGSYNYQMQDSGLQSAQIIDAIIRQSR